MRFNAAEFLGGLYGAEAQPAAVKARAPESGMAAGDKRCPVSDESTGWIWRPDAAGRLGLEPEGLPEAARWSSVATFGELSEGRTPASDAQAAPAKTVKADCRCGSTTTVEIPIHDGRSARLDCACCGRFVGFPVWNGKRQSITRSVVDNNIKTP